MDTKFEIYVPSNNLKLAMEYANAISDQFGGCTVRPGNRGFWIDPTGRLAFDDIIIIEVYAFSSAKSYIDALAGKIATDLKQQCVSVTETKAQMTFIYP